MYYYRGILTLDDGKQIDLKQIGKGAFSKAYVTKKGKPEVYLITQEEDAGDFSKRILSDINERTRSNYLPRVFDVGCLNDGSCVYRMPLYNAPLRKSDSPKAWKQAKALQKCLKEANEYVERKLRREYGYNWWRQGRYAQRGSWTRNAVLECARKNKLPKGLIRALELLSDGTLDYVESYTFEFPARNLATTESGHLVLLDVIFDLRSLEQQRAKQRRW